MTNVFVSYSRADKARVEPLVAFLDAHVGEVWWDDRLIAGESFTEETERRLNEADYIVVVWTPTSAKSKWVLDEAAVGRDAGKLLPVSFDGQMPPLGFRHVHTTDFSKWSGTPDEKCARALKQALTRGGKGTPPGDAPGTVPPLPRAGRQWKIPAIVAGAVAIVLAAIAVLKIAPGIGGPPKSSVAVLPFVDLSVKKDRAYFAEGIAEEILSALARDPALKVIGRTSSAKFAGGDFDIGDIRRALNVEHVLEGSIRAVAGRIKINVALRRTKDGVRVWSEDYDRPEYDIFAIENEIGKAVADRLGGEGDAVTVSSTTSVSALDLLLEARQKLRERTPEDFLNARGLLERAMGLDPASAAIHGALAEAVYFTHEGNFFRNKDDPNKARQLAEKAIALDPNRADGYAALSLILSNEQAAQRPVLEKAVALDPSRSDLRMWLTGHQNNQELYLEGMRTVIAFDPLWHQPVRNLAWRLSELGRLDEAERAIADYEVRAPDDTTNPNLSRGEIAEARGDLTAAYKAYSSIRPQTKDAFFSRSLILAILGMDDEVAALVPIMEIPPDAWRRRDSETLFRLTEALPRFYTAIPYEVFADHRRGALILRLYDGKLGAPDRFCAKIADFGVTRGAPALVWALQAAKRSDEATAIAACAETQLRKGIALKEQAGFSYFYIAQLDALAGKRASAMANLQKALELNYRGNFYSLDFREYRAFDILQSDPKFRSLQQSNDAEAARQRAEILRFDEDAKKSGKNTG